MFFFCFFVPRKQTAFRKSEFRNHANLAVYMRHIFFCLYACPLSVPHGYAIDKKQPQQTPHVTKF